MAKKSKQDPQKFECQAQVRSRKPRKTRPTCIAGGEETSSEAVIDREEEWGKAFLMQIRRSVLRICLADGVGKLIHTLVYSIELFALPSTYILCKQLLSPSYRHVLDISQCAHDALLGYSAGISGVRRIASCDLSCVTLYCFRLIVLVDQPLHFSR